MIYKTIEKLLDLLRRNHHFQDYINTRFVIKDDILLINKKYIKNSTYKVNDKLFFISRCMESLDTINDDYIYSDIKKDDIVVDIGANVGGFSIPVSDFCYHVFAIEPLFVTELEKNIKLNNVSNCTIIPFGLGLKSTILNYNNISNFVKCVPLADIKKMVGGKIDFLKIDCEGCEWCIKKDDLNGIRRLEIELHLFNKENKNDFLNILDDVGFKYNIIPMNNPQTYLIHAKNEGLV